MTQDLKQAAQMALEALESLQGGCTDSQDGTVESITVWCPEVIDALRAALTAPAQVPMTYGCHCDLAPGEQPDGCVLDEDRPQDCVHARSGKTKATCHHWRPIGITQQDAPTVAAQGEGV